MPLFVLLVASIVMGFLGIFWGLPLFLSMVCSGLGLLYTLAKLVFGDLSSGEAAPYLIGGVVIFIIFVFAISAWLASDYSLVFSISMSG